MKLPTRYVGTREVPGFESQPLSAKISSSLVVVLPIQELNRTDSPFMKLLDSEQLVVFLAPKANDVYGFEKKHEFLTKDFIVVNALDAAFSLASFESDFDKMLDKLRIKLQTRIQFNVAIRDFQYKCRQAQSLTNASLSTVMNLAGVRSWIPDVPSKNQFFVHWSFPKYVSNLRLVNVLNTSAPHHGVFDVDQVSANVHIYWADHSSVDDLLKYTIGTIGKELHAVLIMEQKTDEDKYMFDPLEHPNLTAFVYIKTDTPDASDNERQNSTFIVNTTLDALDFLQDTKVYSLNNSFKGLSDGKDDYKSVFDRVRESYQRAK